LKEIFPDKKALTKVQAAVIVIVIAVAAIGGVVYYLSQPSGVTEKTEILLGHVAHLTGSYAYEGTIAAHGTMLAVDDINDKGGVYVEEYGKKLPLRLIVEDDASDPEKTKIATEKLCTVDNVDFLIAPGGSTWNLAAVPISEKYHKLCIGWGGSAEELWTSGFKYYFGFTTVNDLYSGMYYAGIIGFLAHYEEWLPEGAPPPLTVALIGMNNAYGRCAVDIMEKLIKKHGVQTIVMKEYFDPKTTDFTPLITKIQTTKPDAVIVVGYSSQNTNFFRQVIEMKVKEVKIWCPSCWFPQYFLTLGYDGLEYFFDQQYWINYLSDEARDICQRAQEKWDYDHSLGYFAWGYDGVYVLAQAIEKAGSLDTEKVRTALLTETFHSMTYGDITFQENGLPFVEDFELKVPIRQVVGHKQVVVWPLEYKEADPIYPPPWDEKYGS